MSTDLAFTGRIPVTHRMATGVAAGLLAGLAGVFISFFSRVEPLTSAWYLIPLAWVTGGVLLLVPDWRRFGGGLLIGATVATAITIGLVVVAYFFILAQLGESIAG